MRHNVIMRMRDAYDEDVAVTVTDLRQARAAIGVLGRLLEKGAITDRNWLEIIGRVVTVGPQDEEDLPRSAREVNRSLRGLWGRINAWMPWR